MPILPPAKTDDSGIDWRNDYFPDTDLRPLGVFEIPANLSRRIKAENFPAGGTTYGLRTIRADASKLSATTEGSRNSSLWTSGCRVGELVGGGELVLSHAARTLQDAARRSGLLDSEIQQVLLRRDGALMTGISTPRNRHGYLLEMYGKATLGPSTFNGNLNVHSPVVWWFERLQSGSASWRGMTIASRITELGVIYRSNYIYFLSQIHRLVLEGEPGTKALFDALDEEYRAQADEWELIYLDSMGNLGAVIANNLPPDRKGNTRVIDYAELVRDAS